MRLEVSAFTVSGADATVVLLAGEHDIATDGMLSRVLEDAISLNDAPIVLDLSGVQLMGASTLGVIVAARQRLRRRSRSLTVRSPSPFVRRVIGICDLDCLLGAGAGCEQPGELPTEAMHSWVPAPVADRQVGTCVRARERVFACAADRTEPEARAISTDLPGSSE